MYLGKREVPVERDGSGRLIDNLPPSLRLETPILFSAMSYGAISYTAHLALARAAERLGIYYNTGEGGLTRISTPTAPTPSSRWPRAASASTSSISTPARPSRSKWAQGAKPGIGGHLPGEKVARTCPGPA